MNHLDIIAGYMPAGDLATILICITMYVIVFESSVKLDKKYKIFFNCLGTLILACISDLLQYIFALSDTAPAISIYISRDFYHAMLLVTLAMFVQYLNELLMVEGFANRFLSTASTCIAVAAIFLDIMAPVLHTGLYLDESGTWQNTNSVTVFTVAYAFALILMAFQLIFYRDRLFYHVQRALLILEAISGCIVLFSVYIAGTSFLTMTYLPAMLLVLIMIHSNSYDIGTGALGRESFIESNDRIFNKENGKAFYLALRIYEGAENVLEADSGKIFYRLWTDYFKHASFYNVEDNLYVLMADTTSDPLNEEGLYRLLDRDFPRFVQAFHIKWRVIGIEMNENFTTTEFHHTLRYLTDGMEMNTYKICNEDDYAKIIRRHDIIAQLKDISEKKDLDDERILVYAQPVYNVKRKCYDTAEALMRMQLPGLGLVFPDQFISLAEENGYIHALSLIIFNKTCKVIHDLIEDGYDVDRISVNFSVLELYDDHFIEEIQKIIADCQIPMDKIAIELTESKTDEDYATVLDKVKQLKEANIHLYLDDFGTGYSNFDRIIRLKLNVIKFDRSLLLMMDDEARKKAEEVGIDLSDTQNQEKIFENLNNNMDENEGILLIKHFSRAFHEMGYEILYEGVETELMEKFCIDSHADYLQGYKYSKPVPIEELRDKFFKKLIDQ